MPTLMFWRQSLVGVALAGACLGPMVFLVERSGFGMVATLIALCVIGCAYVLWIWYILFDGFERDLIARLLRRASAAARPAA
jgi:hypothetical protein